MLVLPIKVDGEIDKLNKNFLWDDRWRKRSNHINNIELELYRLYH